MRRGRRYEGAVCGEGDEKRALCAGSNVKRALCAEVATYCTEGAACGEGDVKRAPHGAVVRGDRERSFPRAHCGLCNS